DIARDPRWGRIVEGAGEDPYLGAAFAAARVRGFQGSGLRARDAIAATAKHFAAYGAAEGGRDYNVAEVSERTLRDVYLPPFHGAVCAGAATLMASFNEIAGVPSHANHHLLTAILRNEWKFDGLVVSDWTGVLALINHGVAANSAAARDAGRRSIVLLKNDRQTLPLRKDIATLAVIGALAADSGVVLGNWGALGRREDAVPVLDGIRHAVSAQTNVSYVRGA